MAIPNPELVRDARFYGERIVLADRVSFPTKLWLPTIMEIIETTTVGEQHQAMSGAIINVIGSDIGLVPRGEGRLVTDGNDSYFRARFRYDSEHGRARLSFVNTGSDGRIGYQTPDEEQPNPAFAVIDLATDKYHRVVRNPDEKLSPVESNLGYRVLRGLAYSLDNRYPGAELLEQVREKIPDFPH